VVDYNSLAGQPQLQGLAGLGMAPGAGMDLSQQFSFPGLSALAPSSTPDNSMGTALTNSLSGFHSSPGNGSMNSQTSSISTVNFPMNFMGLSSGLQMMHSGAAAAAAGPGQGLPPTPVSKQRLFVVVHKSVTEDVLQRLFRQYPGMEYCDLKKDRATGKSKGYCYVNYSTPVAAAAAVEQLNGVEFPPGTGFRIKVMFAEMLAHSGSSNSLRSPGNRSSSSLCAAGGGGGVAGPSPGTAAAAAAAAAGLQQVQLSSASTSPSPHGRLGPGMVDGGLPMVQVPDSLSNMSLPRMGDGTVGVAAADGSSGYELGGGSGAGMTTSPVNHQVARELMFSVGA